MRKFFFVFALLTGFLISLSSAVIWAEYIGTAPTGLISLEEKHPCYCYVPAAYTPEKEWPLLLLLGDRGEDPKELIQPWVDWAQKNQFIVLAPSNLLSEKEKPDALDQWLLGLKQQATERYRVDPRQVLLVGFDSGAHYAAYLSLQYAGEFSAAALVRKAWAGPLAPLIDSVRTSDEHAAFYLMLDPKASDFSEIQAKSMALEKEGYPITSQPLEGNENLPALQEQIIGWFHQTLGPAEPVSGEAEKRPNTVWRQMKKNLFED